VSAPPHRELLIDTDIGSDVDDALALATILGSASRLLGCTTAYGDTVLRARIVKRLARLANRDVIAVPGAGDTLSGAPVWWAGHEGKLHPGLDGEEVDRADPAAFLAAPVDEHPGQVDLLCLAPLTNIATVIRKYPGFARNVRSLVIMGGRWFSEGTPEHNFASDVEAACAVFGSGAPIRVVGLDVTEQVTLDDAAVEHIAGSGALGETLAAEVRQWLGVFDDMVNTPHDAVTAIALLEPGLFEFTPPGFAHIDTEAGRAGATTFIPDPAGTVRIATAVDVPAVTERIVSAIRRAGLVEVDRPGG
jgi:purine nucleosidase